MCAGDWGCASGYTQSGMTANKGDEKVVCHHGPKAMQRMHDVDITYTIKRLHNDSASSNVLD